MHIYEDVLNRIESVNNENDEYMCLSNNTFNLPWLTTPMTNNCIQHRIVVDTSQESGQVVKTGSTDHYSEVDLNSQSSGASTVYTRHNPQSTKKVSVVIEDKEKTVNQGNNGVIKVHYYVLQIVFITLILILLSTITCLQDF